MSPPGVCSEEGTEMPKPLSSMKNSIGNDSVVAIVNADQKPLVATEPSPPSATAIARPAAASPSVLCR